MLKAMSSSGGRQRREMIVAAFFAIFLILTSAACFGQKNGYARGHILVKFRNMADAPGQQRAMGRVHANGVWKLGNLPVHMLFLPQGEDEQSAVTTLEDDPNVEYAEVDARVKPALTSNDPSYSSQWFLPNIKADQAWNLTTGSPNVIVAVLDTGCDPTHPDLVPNYVAGWNFYDNNSNTSDVYGHGTAVAGCVGAAGGNGLGIASVSWNSRLMPLRVTDTTGYAYYSTIASALNYAADHGAKIANISFSGVQGSASIQSAAQYMYSKGGLTVCAAANDGVDPGFSANSYLINVSATDSSNNRASWSDFGNFITVAAPGVNIYTTTNGGGYGAWNGTSFSAPITCGVLAMIWAANPGLTNGQVQNILTSTATDLGTAGWDVYYGYGKVNVYGAVTMAMSTTTSANDVMAPSVTLTNPTSGAMVNGSITLTANAVDNVGVTKVAFYANGTLVGTATTAPYSCTWSTSKVANGSYALTAVAYDGAGNAGSSSTVSVTVNNVVDTTAPTCVITSPTGGTTIGNSLNMNVSASDNVGVSRVEFYVDGSLKATSTSAPYSFSLNTRKWSKGTHTLQAKAYDAAGNQGSSAVVSVLH